MKWLTSTFTYWYDLYRDIRMWWIFRKTARENIEMLNKDHELRVDWLGRIYGVVNLPEEVRSASLDVQQAYVLQQITKYGDCMLKIGLADVVLTTASIGLNEVEYERQPHAGKIFSYQTAEIGYGENCFQSDLNGGFLN